MDFEFETVYGKVPQRLIDKITYQVVKRLITSDDILKATVKLEEQETFSNDKRMASEIRVTFENYDELHVFALADDFERSSLKAMDKLMFHIESRTDKKKLLSVNDVLVA